MFVKTADEQAYISNDQEPFNDTNTAVYGHLLK